MMSKDSLKVHKQAKKKEKHNFIKNLFSIIRRKVSKNSKINKVTNISYKHLNDIYKTKIIIVDNRNCGHGKRLASSGIKQDFDFNFL